MSENFRNQLYRNLNQKETDELVEIWQTNNHIEWTEMAFDVIQEILQERQVEFPPQDEPITEESETGTLEVPEVTNMTIAQILFSFNGRIGRGTYWLAAFFIIAFTTIVALIDTIVFDYSSYSGIPTLLARLLIIWPSLAITIKRWHDRDKSGWWILIGIIPYLGLIWAFIETGFLPGTKGPNQYGSKSF